MVQVDMREVVRKLEAAHVCDATGSPSDEDDEEPGPNAAAVRAPAHLFRGAGNRVGVPGTLHRCVGTRCSAVCR